MRLGTKKKGACIKGGAVSLGGGGSASGKRREKTLIVPSYEEKSLTQAKARSGAQIIPAEGA